MGVNPVHLTCLAFVGLAQTKGPHSPASCFPQWPIREAQMEGMKTIDLVLSKRPAASKAILYEIRRVLRQAAASPRSQNVVLWGTAKEYSKFRHGHNS